MCNNPFVSKIWSIIRFDQRLFHKPGKLKLAYSFIGITILLNLLMGIGTFNIDRTFVQKFSEARVRLQIDTDKFAGVQEMDSRNFKTIEKTVMALGFLIFFMALANFGAAIFAYVSLRWPQPRQVFAFMSLNIFLVIIAVTWIVLESNFDQKHQDSLNKFPGFLVDFEITVLIFLLESVNSTAHTLTLRY